MGGLVAENSQPQEFPIRGREKLWITTHERDPLNFYITITAY